MKLTYIKRIFNTEEEAKFFYNYEIKHQKYYRGLRIKARGIDDSIVSFTVAG